MRLPTNKEKRDIVEYIAEHIELTEQGSGDSVYYTARCPFHDDSSPSFVVYPGIQKYRCYGCMSQWGDVIDFARQYFQCSFAEAVERTCIEISVDEVIAKEVSSLITSARNPKTDWLWYNTRMRKLFDALPASTANKIACRVSDMVENGKFLLADRELKRHKC